MGNLDNHLGFSSRLLSAIAECRGKVEEWTEREKRAADEMERKYKRTLSLEQAKINSLEDELLSLQFKLGTNIKETIPGSPHESIAHRQQSLLEEKEQLEADIAKLKAARDTRDRMVKRLEKEEAIERARAAEVRAKKKFAEESKNTTVDDLTKGIINYKFLGLDFEKADNQQLRFCFSQIDPDQPSKRFWFVLGANDFNFYEIDTCNPPIDHAEQERLLAKLNHDDDLGQFVLKMRSAFVELVWTV